MVLRMSLWDNVGMYNSSGQWERVCVYGCVYICVCATRVLCTGWKGSIHGTYVLIDMFMYVVMQARVCMCVVYVTICHV